MYKDRVIPRILFAMGLLLAGIAVVAEIIGLDKSPGNWGVIRVAILTVGIIFMLFAGAYSSIDRVVRAAKSRMNLFLQHRTITRLFNNKLFQTLLKTVRVHSFTVLIPVIILLFYTWFASSGTWTTWKSPTYYYSGLAEAFLNGDLNLPLQPDLQVLALENPYDPSARAGLETPVDISLYNGKYYLYWGPAPALLLALIQFFDHKQIGDLVLAFVFACGIFLAQSLFLFTVWNRYFHSLPKWFLHLSILLGGLAPLILLRHNYDNARIYEAAIAGGQFFLISGLLMLITSLISPSIPNWKLVSAGLLWILAIGTRNLLVVPIGFMAALAALSLIKSHLDFAGKIAKLISLFLPLIIGFAGLVWYNWARFGSVNETGFSYALASIDLQVHAKELFSESYIFQNLYNYLFNPPSFMSKFPFVFMLKGSEIPILHFYTVPEFYNAQPVTGIIYIIPFVIFSIVPLIALSRNLYHRGFTDFILSSTDPKLPTWILVNLGGAFLIAFCLLTGFFWAGMRYFGDFIPELMMLSALGFWQGYTFFANKPYANGFYLFMAISLACLSFLTSVLLVISTNSKLINLIARNFTFLK